MVDLTIYLNDELLKDCPREQLINKVTSAINRSFRKGVKVSVSECRTNKAVDLIFNDMSPVEIDDIEVIVDDVIDAVVFEFNSLDKKVIGVTIHPTIIYEIEVELN